MQAVPICLLVYLFNGPINSGDPLIQVKMNFDLDTKFGCLNIVNGGKIQIGSGITGLPVSIKWQKDLLNKRLALPTAHGVCVWGGGRGAITLAFPEGPSHFLMPGATRPWGDREFSRDGPQYHHRATGVMPTDSSGAAFLSIEGSEEI